MPPPSTGIKVFFAHPNSRWERGINKNTDDLLHRLLFKGTDFSVYTQQARHHRFSPKCQALQGSLGRKFSAELFLPAGSFDFKMNWSTITDLIAFGVNPSTKNTKAPPKVTKAGLMLAVRD
jgi:hypothetical protein